MKIQTEIKAPKNLYNSFGKYKYRNAEGICEAVKPFLEREKVCLTLSDSIEEIGGRVYVKATATLASLEENEAVSVSAFAREPDSKKGNDESQITGAASSYARKYALNGLFLLDDTKDADSNEHAEEVKARKEKEEEEARAEEIGKQTISMTKVKALSARCEKEGVKHGVIYSLYKVEHFSELTENQYANINSFWDKLIEKSKEVEKCDSSAN